MQELFVRLSNTKSLDRVAHPIAYARRAAINLAFDWRLRQKQQPVSLGKVRELASKGNSPLDKLIQTEEMQEVLNAIGRLNGLSRDAFVMHYIKQDSYEEIAHTLEKDPHQIRALCSKALARLKNLLGHGQPRPSGEEVSDVSD